MTSALWSSGPTAPSCSRQYLEIVEYENERDIWIKLHPTEKIKFHSTAVVDPGTVAPGFFEIEGHFQDTFFWQTWERLV